MIGNFNKQMILDANNFNNIISWDDQILERGNYVDGKYNFLISNEYTLDDYCNLLHQQCHDYDLKCFDQFSQRQQQFIPNLTEMMYKEYQYQSWSSSLCLQWEQLAKEQQIKIILASLSASVTKALTTNSNLKEIGVQSYYITFQSDGIFVSNELRFTDSSQFNGFQFMDNHGELCQDSSCSCQYYNMKRLLPLDWRCRPWFYSSYKEYQITFSAPYSDLTTNSSDTTITYKITQNQNEYNIEQEKNMNTIAVQSVDLELNQVKQRLSNSQNISLEYSYIVSPKTFNYDENQGYYELIAMVHPLSNGTIQNITDIEFQNSTNKQEEINEYLQNVDFMLNTDIRGVGAEKFLQDQKIFKTIQKNGQNYLVYFTQLRVCYGNLYTQENIIFGYLARVISTEVIKTQLDIVVIRFSPMKIALFLTYTSCLVFSSIALSMLLAKFLKYNFDIPINILNQLVCQSQIQEVHTFSDMIRKGQIKTQQELKNLIFAIDSRVFAQYLVYNFMKIYASRNYQLANLLIQTCSIVKQEVSINKKITLNEASESNLNGSEFLKINSDLLSGNRAESNNLNISYKLSPQSQMGDDKKVILAQAIDLLWESQQIFNILSSINYNDNDVNELRLRNTFSTIFFGVDIIFKRLMSLTIFNTNWKF
ncbi:transmembrane protein, putative (macronuclear) [Tetrahymena thermophila SB210]|uniref:Transmembrane protein, putative n=1 Tax=Tetrahymena thermophila (strain SB210) TaxID=312017 RepID=I7MG95_TETTS|nr:transmembrane protein, putative [Tetrahymena thermophila SB210]EAS01258.2 transmembrane protein, putative [Tetrahymena thermophila SB210]|eukprot:XP_001021503.2 transmembrane protein, putative [Tetrahymena thermophila SB210]